MLGTDKARLYIAGQWVAPASTRAVRSPYDGSEVGVAPQASPDQVEQATQAAVAAFPQASRLPAYRRSQALQAISLTLRERKDQFAQVLCAEAGKPIRDSRAEVDRAAFTFQVASEEAERIGGELLPLDLQPHSVGKLGITRRFPLGPVAAITPFNFPLNLVCHKVAPAIAAGDTIVLKPASQTPFCALLLAELISETDLPAGMVNVIPCSAQDASLLVTDERFNLLTFTGSAAVGWALKEKAGKKRVVLELGGNAACVIHSDADLEIAAAQCVRGGYYYAGQSCISVQRILVHRPAYSQFCDHLVSLVQQLKVGDPRDETVDVGPMITDADAIRCQEWIREMDSGSSGTGRPPPHWRRALGSHRAACRAGGGPLRHARVAGRGIRAPGGCRTL